MCTRIGGPRALPFHAVDVNALPIGAPIPLNTFPSSSQRKGTRKHHQLKTLYVPGRRRFLEHPSRAESDGEIEIGFNPRKRKLSQAQDVVARTRAHWGELQRADKENIPLALDIAALREGAQQDENAARRDANGSVRASSEAERTLGGETKQGDDTQDTPSTPRGSSQTAAVIDSLAIPPAVPRPRPRPTRRVRKAPPSELEPYEIEAMRMVIRHAKAGKGQFPCMRSGCGDILKSVDGLARHLYIHDLVPDSPEQAQTSSFGCDFCGGTYKSERELLMHDCARYRGLLPSPKPRLKGTTRRFIETFKLPKLSFGCFNIIPSPSKRTRYD